MAEQHNDDSAREHESRMVKAIVRDISVALPVALLLVFGTLMVFTDKPIGDAIATTLLPGVLIGVFFGGFSGTARTMD
ncbi:MAG: hypothetical protein WD990_05590 [Acidimicrobiia bacterium]